MVGARFGSLTITAVEGKTGGRLRCLCDCGTERIYLRCKVVRGYFVSCGCRKRAQQQTIASRLSRHGAAKAGAHTRTYRIWQAMLNRCRNQKQKTWGRYGGRGISVDPAWESFETFLLDMGDVPPERSLDRIDNDGPYTKANCRWATRTEQRRNTSQITPITIGGFSYYSWEWAEQLGVSVRKVRSMWSKVKKGTWTELDFIRGRKA